MKLSIEKLIYYCLSNKNMKRGIALYALVFTFFIIFGCTNQNSNLAASDLKKITLDKGQLQELNLIAERNFTEKLPSGETYYGYAKTFNNAVSAGGKSAKGYKEVVNRAYVFSSPEVASNFIVKSYQDLNKFNTGKIGDESYAFSGTLSGKDSIMIWFRKNNVVSVVILQGGDSNEAYRYAKMIEAKIK